MTAVWRCGPRSQGKLPPGMSLAPGLRSCACALRARWCAVAMAGQNTVHELALATTKITLPLLPFSCRKPPSQPRGGRESWYNAKRCWFTCSSLCGKTATRPVTTENLHFAPPCAKPAGHHRTPHQDGRLFNATQKKENAAPSNGTSRTRTNRHNTSDVRCEGGVTPCTLSAVAGS